MEECCRRNKAEGMRKMGKYSKRLLCISTKTESPDVNEVGDGRGERRMTLFIHQPHHFNTSFQVAFIWHFPDLSAVITMISVDSTASY